MTTIEVTKADIIKALQKQRHLRFASWGYGDCCCAVGAVVTRTLPRGASIEDACSASVIDENSDRAPVRLAKQGHHMDALMCAFERFGQINGDEDRGAGYASAKTRRETIAFVRTHFPARIRFSIDGAKPRRGVKVVK
jgi:hypothetical protein